MILNQKITLDLTIDRVQNVHCSQDDDESRKILITLSDKGKPYVLPESSVICLKISKPDGTFIYIDEDDVSHLFRNNDGTITIILSDQSTCVSGICEAEFQIIESNTIVSSRKFNIIVKKSVVDGKVIESTIESNIVDKMIKHLIDYDNPHKIPNATSTTDGLLSKENKIEYDDANQKKHTHENKTILDNITSSSIKDWEEKLDAKAEKIHLHESNDIISLDASKLTGTVDIQRLPQGALDRLIKVTDDTARFKLTTSDVQLGDTVKVINTKKMYIVIDESKLSSEDGYEVYTADTATSVPWSGITDKPTTYSPSEHTHTKSEITDFPISMPANGGNSETVNNHTVNADVPANAKFTDTVYTHPTTSGNKHIPSGGSSGQILGWQSDGIAKWIANENSGGYIDLGQFNNNNRTINLDDYKPYAKCDSKGDNTTWSVPSDRNCVAWIRSIDNTGTNPPQFGSSEIWFYFRSTMVNGMPLQEIVVYSAVNDGTPKNTYLNRAFCNNAWTSWWGDVDYLKLIGGVMTGPINFASGNPIQMKPASWTSYVQTLVCDGNVKVGVNNFSSFWNNAINLIMLSTAATYIRWKNGNGCYFQAITNSNGTIDNKLAITPSNILLSYGLPLYEAVSNNGSLTSYRLISVNTSANLHIGGNTSTGNNNISSAILSVLNCQYGFYDTAFRVMEAYDNKVSLGGGYARWKQVYAKNTSISTSDRNLKHDIHDIDDNLIKLFFKIKPKTYYFNDGDRIHIGLIAQDFENSMHELGLSENDYGMICKDILYDYTKFDEDGVPIEDSKVPKKDEDGNIIYRYSFRYEELITLIVQVVHNQQKELDDIRDNIAELNQKLENLK